MYKEQVKILTSYTENRDQAREYLRLTLQYLSKYRLIPNPVNLTIWYEYAAGKNTKLKKAINSLIKKSDTINPDQIENLYERHITDGQRVVQEKFLKQLNYILKELGLFFSGSMSELSGHGEKLKSLSKQVTKAKGFNEVGNIVDQMVAETTILISSAKKMQSEMKASSGKLAKMSRELKNAQKEALTDALTGLLNKRGFEQGFELEKLKSNQSGMAFSVIMLDVDFFKEINDNFGHLVGDSILKEMAMIFRNYFRKNDHIARIGGDEFCIVMPETKLMEACSAALNIKNVITAKKWKLTKNKSKIINATVSMGIAQYQSNESGQNLMQRADEAMYLAKKNGRNKIKTQNDL